MVFVVRGAAKGASELGSQEGIDKTMQLGMRQQPRPGGWESAQWQNLWLG